MSDFPGNIPSSLVVVVDEIEEKVEREDEDEETLDDEGVVCEAHQVVEDARQSWSTEVSRSEGGGEEAGHN